MTLKNVAPLVWARIALLLITLVGYALTMAPSLSFWDCGEFIAASHVLGIPHPPGTPLFILLGRVFDLALFWLHPVSYRINWLSVLSSVGGALLALEITATITSDWKITAWVRAATAFAAGGLLAFSDTYWFNAVEAEVYGVSMALLLLGVWSLLKWDQADPQNRNRWLIFFVYLTFLATGIHTNSMIAFPLGWIFVGVRSGYLNPRFWIYCLLGFCVSVLGLMLYKPLLYGNSVFLAVIGITFFSGLLLAWRTREIRAAWFWVLGVFLFSVVFLVGPFLAGLAVAIVGCGILLIFVRKAGVKLVLSLLLAAAVGFSVQLVLPVRSSTHPILNENEPVSWPALRDALERKQYGSMGMLERALWRRGQITSQVGFADRVGYLGYHLNQFLPAPLGAQQPFRMQQTIDNGIIGWLHVGHRILWETVLAAVLLAGFLLYRRPQAFFLWSLFGVTVLGLIFYVNFADGTQPDSDDALHWMKRIAEVQDKVSDPNLAALPDLATMGAAIEEYSRTRVQTPLIRSLMDWERALNAQGMHLPMPPRAVHREVRERDYFYTPAFAFFAILMGLSLAFWTETKPSRLVQKTVVVLCALLWIMPFASHYELHNRSKDWIPDHFARNILSSVPPNGILVTFGDNDTFPLWNLQMAEGFRTDVLVINTSLAQMDWYQRQLLAQRPDLKVTKTVEARMQSAYAAALSRRIMVRDTSYFYAGDSVWHPNPADQFIMEVITQNWPRVPVCYMYNASESEVVGGEKNGERLVPITGLVRQLGVTEHAADSLLVYRVSAGYDLGGLEGGRWRNQEATVHAAMNYRSLFEYAQQFVEGTPDAAKLRERATFLER